MVYSDKNIPIFRESKPDRNIVYVRTKRVKAVLPVNAWSPGNAQLSSGLIALDMTSTESPLNLQSPVPVLKKDVSGKVS